VQQTSHLRCSVDLAAQRSVDNNLLHVDHYARSASLRRASAGAAIGQRRKALIKTFARQKAHLGADDLRLARAIFTLRDTAGLLDVPKSTIRRWARSQDAEHPSRFALRSRAREPVQALVGVAANPVSLIDRFVLPLPLSSYYLTLGSKSK
jgi:hypothetical protein